MIMHFSVELRITLVFEFSSFSSGTVCRLTVQSFILEIQVLKSFYGKYPPNAFFLFKENL